MKLILSIEALGFEPLTPILLDLKPALAGAGVHVTDLFGGERLTGLEAWATPDDEEEGAPAEAEPAAEPAPLDPMTERVRRELDDSAAAGCTHWLLSGDMPLTVKALRKLHERLQPLFEEIRVVIHLRPQLDLLSPVMRARLAEGLATTAETLLDPAVFSPRVKALNYNETVERWEKVFGAEAVEVAPFRRVPNILAHLLLQMGVDPVLLADRAPAPEPAVSARILAFAAALASDPVAAGALARHVDHFPPGEPVQVPSVLAMRLQARFSASNSKLASRRGDVTVEDLTRPSADFTAESTLPADGEAGGAGDFAAEMRILLGRVETDYQTERYFRLLADWRQAIAEGRAAALDALKPEIDALAARLGLTAPVAAA